MTSPFKIGLVGANYGASLASGFSGLENVELVAIADKDSATLAKAAEALGIAQRFESLEEMLSACSLAALIVATPTALHERHVGAAFDQGLHTLCAAPVGVRSSEVSHIVTSAGLVGKTFMWANPLRFDARVAVAAERVAAGEIGTPLSASVEARIADWPHATDSWRLERDLGGGALLEAGVSALDAAWFVMGSPDPMEAMAARYDSFSSSFAKDLEHPAEDFLSGIIRFKNGSTLQLSTQIKAPLPPGESQLLLTLHGTEGSLSIDAGTLRNSVGVESEIATASDEAACYRTLAEAFLEAASSGEEPASGCKQATAFHKMTDALLESAREKEAVSIKVERSLEDLFGGL